MALSMAANLGFLAAYCNILSLATYLAMRNASVHAMVAAIETTAVPRPTPKMAPAVIVRGMAGTARSSSNAYTAM